MYQATTIGNFFIEAGIQRDRMVTPMQLVKMVYISHGWHLAFTGKPLIDEGVQAWKYGPVVSSLYHTFKGYGREKIDNVDLRTRNLLRERERLQQDIALQKFLWIIWDKYSVYSGVELSSMTHQVGTPWQVVWELQGGKDQRGVVIPNCLIEAHFKDVISKQFCHA